MVNNDNNNSNKVNHNLYMNIHIETHIRYDTIRYDTIQNKHRNNSLESIHLHRCQLRVPHADQKHVSDAVRRILGAVDHTGVKHAGLAVAPVMHRVADFDPALAFIHLFVIIALNDDTHKN